MGGVTLRPKKGKLDPILGLLSLSQSHMYSIFKIFYFPFFILTSKVLLEDDPHGELDQIRRS